jgi:hypothetical protein
VRERERERERERKSYRNIYSSEAKIMGLKKSQRNENKKTPGNP